MRSLTWDQVNAWRLAQHGLSPRLKRQDFVEAVTRTGGIQAQVMSAAELAVWARVDGLTREDVQSALWKDRALVKTWAMRGTLHLISAGELPLYVAARSVNDNRGWGHYAYFGLTAAQYDAFLAAVPQVLSSEPMTREQFTTAVAAHLEDPELGRILLASSWGSLFKPSAFRGDLCFGPSQGRNVTFVNPGRWINLQAEQNGQPVEPHLALQEIARRYLKAYGPAKPEDFALWWWGGGGISQARKVFKSLEDEMEEVDVEGWRGLALRATIESMEESEVSGSVNLLPLFDAYVLGTGRNIEPILPRAYKNQVFRPQGWITAVVLVDGYMKGVWDYTTERAQRVLKVRMFSTTPPAALVREGIEAEAERLAAFLNTKVVLEYKENQQHG
ncbi:MAG: winged helix DNA-binding domain-containing protein [Chloroflexota bacterium]|nr:winged helix DNA-binding domain-containing protein [Chloroflexota bacterium]